MTSVSKITEKMIAYSDGNLHDINHFMKVWGYAKIIGELEQLDARTQFILEIAAITHDIACPLCREKYGNTNGKLQETEGAELVVRFLKDTDLSKEELLRVAYLVGHHHTYSPVNELDHQILLEADYLVNADESSASQEQVRNAYDQIFRTETGKRLLRSVYAF